MKRQADPHVKRIKKIRFGLRHGLIINKPLINANIRDYFKRGKKFRQSILFDFEPGYFEEMTKQPEPSYEPKSLESIVSDIQSLIDSISNTTQGKTQADTLIVPEKLTDKWGYR